MNEELCKARSEEARKREEIDRLRAQEPMLIADLVRLQIAHTRAFEELQNLRKLNVAAAERNSNAFAEFREAQERLEVHIYKRAELERE